MTWEAVGAIAAALVALLALRHSKRAQQQADDVAKTQIQLSKDQKALSERQAQAQEGQVAQLEALVKAVSRDTAAELLERREIETERQSDEPGVAWRLQHLSADAYQLSNAGRATAYDVTVEIGDMVGVRPMSGQDVPPGGSLKVVAERKPYTRDDVVTVNWADGRAGTGANDTLGSGHFP